MPQFRTTFECTAFAGAGVDPDLGLTEAECDGVTSTFLAEGTFPQGVLGVLGAHVAVDDSVHAEGRDQGGDVKIFVSIDLLIEAADEEAAEEFAPPKDLLSRISDMVSTDYSLDGDWEVLDAQLFEAPASAPAP